MIERCPHCQTVLEIPEGYVYKDFGGQPVQLPSLSFISPVSIWAVPEGSDMNPLSDDAIVVHRCHEIENEEA